MTQTSSGSASRRRSALRWLSWAVAAAVLVLLRPGLVAQSVRSPRAWLTLLAVVALAALARLITARLAGPRAATAAGAAIVLLATLLLIGPSFRQRTLVEALPPDARGAAVTAPVQPAETIATGASGAPSAAPASATTSRVAPATVAPSATPPRPTPPASTPRATPPAAAPSPSQERPAARQVASGELRGIDHSASGTLRLIDAADGGLIRFDDVDIEGSVGPSVHLVPYGARTPGTGIRLGALKAERGSFSYRLPASVDVTQRWSVLVWCDPYDTPIAAADLQNSRS